MLRIAVLAFFLGLMVAPSFAQTKQKVIFDCDLGDDIDDAFALALVVANDQFDVLGITTTYGRTDDRAELACKMLYELGLEKIPVAVGRNTSSTSERANWYAPQYYWAKGFNKVKPIQKPAADFIIEQIRKYPNEVVVISVGPVTNMADVIKKDPQALKMAKKVYAMFGSFYIGYNYSPTINKEWNVVADVESAKTFVNNSGINIIYAGLDITTFVKADKAYREKMLYRQSPLTNGILGLHSLWNYNNDPTLFDAVAVGMVLWPDLFKTKPMHVIVDNEGYTRMDESKTPNGEVGVSIDKEGFLKRLMEVYMKQNLGRY
ncbi:nucleoside hydrolase [Telluribacter sp.]|jgi:inosine-uridine nucleoside N-ribohydrolase|uniref:nucleoside hydrolase n=1 Tax=Telluribacter sp. TaxID=1978767 RepID=UPI002E1588C9|nr:nucleoside hydrolase [Telluribacter sp.]